MILKGLTTLLSSPTEVPSGTVKVSSIHYLDININTPLRLNNPKKSLSPLRSRKN